MFCYTVRCGLNNRELADSWLRWLRAEHIDDVIQAGAVSAEIFEMTEPLTYEIRYSFSTKSALDDYFRNHAPRLREEGLQKFPLELGLNYSRTTGRLLDKIPG